MIHIIPPSKIEIKKSLGKGLGVFATDKIYKDEIIETCHILTLPLDPNGHILSDYKFAWPRGTNWKENVIALGYGSLYNHSNEPNAYLEDNPKYRGFIFYANQDIAIGEEITVYYGGDEYWDTKKCKLIQ